VPVTMGENEVENDRRADEVAIRELLNRQVMGWDAGDPDNYASVFTPDADYVTFLGSHHKGRDAIAAAYAPLFSKLLKGSRLDTEITQLRFITRDVAIIHINATATKKAQGRRRCHKRINTTIAVRTDGRWMLAASQNTTRRWLVEKLMYGLAKPPHRPARSGRTIGTTS
jgi:uncharacterized protein (TIGR02246 family)